MLRDNVMDKKEIKRLVNKSIKTEFIKQIIFTIIKELFLSFALYETISFIWYSFEIMAYGIHNSQASITIITVLFYFIYTYIYNLRTIKKLRHEKNEK